MDQRIQGKSSARRAAHTRAFSLLEIMIAIGVLGVGLIMVSAMFPIAITQHRQGLDQARATELLSKARSIMKARCSGVSLWADPNLTHPITDSIILGRDSPWYMLPMMNLGLGQTQWDWMRSFAPDAPGQAYADAINGYKTEYFTSFFQRPNGPGIFPPALGLGIIFGGTDVLSDRFGPGSNASPFTDDQFIESSNRFVWIGFYRRLATGSYQFAAAVCKLSRNDVFAEQDLSQQPFFPEAATAIDPSVLSRRLPVPWRVRALPFVGKRFSNLSFNPAESLGELAPPGSKVMIAGWSYSLSVPPAAPPLAPTGRVFTVASVFDDESANTSTPGSPQYAIEVIEDINDIPNAALDLWVFPPPIAAVNTTIEFGRQSPLVEWKVNL